MPNWGIILAAGAGKRMGSPKAFLTLQGKPLLFYSLAAFEKSRSIDKFGVVCREEDIAEVQSLVKSLSLQKVAFIVPGGKERQDSVFEGVRALPNDVEIVAVHDAARPLVTADLIDAAIRNAEKTGACLIAIPTPDTIKVSCNGRVEQTLKRETLWSAQTPQAFKVSHLRNALKQARADNFYGTDCASLVERIGITVHLLEGSPENFKVTTQADAIMAEAVLSRREEDEIKMRKR